MHLQERRARGEGMNSGRRDLVDGVGRLVRSTETGTERKH